MAAISRWSEPAGTALSSASTCRRDDAAGVGNPSAAQGAGLDSIAPRRQNPDAQNPDTRCYNGRAMTDTLTRCDATPGRYSGRSEERRVGTSVSVRVDLGGRRVIKKKIIQHK